eukprot:NODE_3516_length_546_cov_58.191147_g2977_i0.p4 GENE.NODE_3516_length_546_cov_58.191147_g2977_i0~~NODE_3516_length_546_cov_58.191147_g2977_i0.p4  ORF type:complete len:85 (+),score=22.99 NODE_3516_length_546_cov_58.191147_g2977_i0:70-324(+)
MSLTIFGSPFCRHCMAAKDDLKAFKPTFVNCNDEKNEYTCKQHKVVSYPKIFNGAKVVNGWPDKEDDNAEKRAWYWSQLGLKKP